MPERLKDLDPDGMRVEPLGEDSDGVVFWYFYGVRLYKEVKAGKPKKPRKKKKEEKSVDDTGWNYLLFTKQQRGTSFTLQLSGLNSVINQSLKDAELDEEFTVID